METRKKKGKKKRKNEGIPLVEFTYLTRMPGESYRR